MRTFTLVRTEDESGVSGTGVVAEGVEFKNGRCVMNWNTDTTSTAIYNNVQELIKIHGHRGKTKVHFTDGEIVSDVKYMRPGSIVKVTRATAYDVDERNDKWIGRLATVVSVIEESIHVGVVFHEPCPDALDQHREWTKEWLEVV